MMCVTCGELVRLGVFVTKGKPEDGMVCWPCVLESHPEEVFESE